MFTLKTRRIYIQDIPDNSENFNITEHIKFTDKHAKYVTILISKN